MRCVALVAAIFLVGAPPTALAAGSFVELRGPERLNAETPATTALAITLWLDGVVCASEADIPVHVHVTDSEGMRFASLSWDRVLFRITADQAATQPWRGDAEVALNMWAADEIGRVNVKAMFVLPPQCRVLHGAPSGEIEHVVLVDGPPTPLPQIPATPPPAAPPASASLAGFVNGFGDMPRMPLTVVGAILGALAGAGIVLGQRLRPRADQ